MDNATLHRAHFQIKAQTGRRFTGLASTWDLDHGGDLILPGAYSRTLAEWKASGRVIPLIDQHNYGSVTSVVGRMLDADETEAGLEATFEIIGGAQGEPYAERVKSGVIDGLSIGYETRAHRQPNDSERKLGVRRVLEDVELREVSLVIWGMNPHALINTASVKAAIAQIRDEKELRGLASHIGSLLRPAPPASAADAKTDRVEEPDQAAIRRAERLRELTLRELTRGAT
jgi:uncharacterized protein